MSRPLFLGVDGGGTKTQFVLVDGDGNLVASCEGPTSYHLEIGIDGLRNVLADGLAALFRQAGIDGSAIAHAFFGIPATARTARRRCCSMPCRSRCSGIAAIAAATTWSAPGRVRWRRRRNQHRRRNRLDRLWRAPGQVRARRGLGRGLRRRRIGLLDRGAGPQRLHAHERRPPCEGAAPCHVQGIARAAAPISTYAPRS